MDVERQQRRVLPKGEPVPRPGRRSPQPIYPARGATSVRGVRPSTSLGRTLQPVRLNHQRKPPDTVSTSGGVGGRGQQCPLLPDRKTSGQRSQSTGCRINRREFASMACLAWLEGSAADSFLLPRRPRPRAAARCSGRRTAGCGQRNETCRSARPKQGPRGPRPISNLAVGPVASVLPRPRRVWRCRAIQVRPLAWTAFSKGSSVTQGRDPGKRRT